MHDDSMNFKLIEPQSEEWEAIKKYAHDCSWSAGKNLAEDMENMLFGDWERVILAQDENGFAGIARSQKKIA